MAKPTMHSRHVQSFFGEAAGNDSLATARPLRPEKPVEFS